MARTTINRVNAALEAAGFEGVELVRASSYFYFAGGDSVSWRTTGVYGVSRLTGLTVEEWVNEARALSGA